MATSWNLEGTGYEFCNCDFGCGCNFGGFPNSADGSCRALVGYNIGQGSCGDVDLAGVKCAAIIDWPKAIHEGNGKAVFVVDPSTTDAQAGALGQIFTGQLGGMPWELLGPTFEVVGMEKARSRSKARASSRPSRPKGSPKVEATRSRILSPATTTPLKCTCQRGSSGRKANAARGLIRQPLPA